MPNVEVELVEYVQNWQQCILMKVQKKWQT